MELRVVSSHVIDAGDKTRYHRSYNLDNNDDRKELKK
jgi:hypothetical protein